MVEQQQWMDYLKGDIDHDYWMSLDTTDNLRGLKMLDSILPSSCISKSARISQGQVGAAFAYLSRQALTGTHLGRYMAGIFHMARWTLTWFIQQDKTLIRIISSKVKAIPTSNLAGLNNIWYTQQVRFIYGMKPAGFMRYLDDTWPVGLIPR